MKNLQKKIKEEYKSKTIDGRDLTRLMKFVPEDEMKDFGMELKDEYKGKHETILFTRENILIQLKSDVEFGFQKALEVVSMWNWILEEGLENFNSYAQYGLPLFKATAEKYGFENPIGNKAGNEREFASGY